jgi:CheY-like chemotaxis protein
MANILVVDDETHIRELLKLILIRNNHDVVEASDGLEALQIINPELPPDLILIDHQMPRLSGIECSKSLKTLYPSLKIVLVSGSVGLYDDGYLLANRHLFADIILKPFIVRDVIRTVEETLGSESTNQKSYGRA